MKVRSRVLSSWPRGRAWEAEPGRHAGGASPPWRAGWFCCWSRAPPLPLEYSATSPSPGRSPSGSASWEPHSRCPGEGRGSACGSAWTRASGLQRVGPAAAWLLSSLGGSPPVKHMPLAPGSVSRALRPGALCERRLLLPWPEKVGSLLKRLLRAQQGQMPGILLVCAAAARGGASPVRAPRSPSRTRRDAHTRCQAVPPTSQEQPEAKIAGGFASPAAGFPRPTSPATQSTFAGWTGLNGRSTAHIVQGLLHFGSPCVTLSVGS